MNGVLAEVRTVELKSALPTVWTVAVNQVGRLVLQHLYPLSRLPGPILCFEAKTHLIQASLGTCDPPASAA